ncbi:hypothetical protein CKO40_18280 [Halochromatium glycolicum]|uniref:Uncharacterized protein n=1 Tax=Halochromatium glycolicum TaxID=85075 RepID=A0AAJ0XBI5_9GAMM|nr:hypothetical protein [Halochromatium glycolicum]
MRTLRSCPKLLPVRISIEAQVAADRSLQLIIRDAALAKGMTVMMQDEVLAEVRRRRDRDCGAAAGYSPSA